MASSNFSILESQKSDDFARPYSKVGNEVRLVPFYNIDALAPAGAINSNVEEMIRYVRFHLDQGKYGETQVLSARSAERLRTPETVIPELLAGALHNPSTFPELGHTSYGLGFFVTTYRGHEVAWHSGSIDGFSALMTLLPREKIGVIILTNLSGNRPAPICVTRQILDKLLKLDPIDWVARAKELDRKVEQAARERPRASRRNRSPPPLALLERLRRSLRSSRLRDLEVGASGDGLTLAWRNASTPLLHRRFDIFETGTSESDNNPIPRPGSPSPTGLMARSTA